MLKKIGESSYNKNIYEIWKQHLPQQTLIEIILKSGKRLNFSTPLTLDEFVSLFNKRKKTLFIPNDYGEYIFILKKEIASYHIKLIKKDA